jgi:hypothetical protein
MNINDLDIEVDENILKKIKFRIIGLERSNLKTNKYSNIEMADRIIKIIKEETNKNY